LDNGGRASSSADAWAIVSAHFGLMLVNAGRSTLRAGFSDKWPPLDSRSEYRAQDIVNVVRCPGCVSVVDQALTDLQEFSDIGHCHKLDEIRRGSIVLIDANRDW
jgi:hypothetical protein